MKNFNLLALVVSITFVFSSCSTDETLLPEEQSLDLLKSYTIKRDASGAYSLDYSLNGNAEIDNVNDLKTNTNQIYLYSSDNITSKNISKELSIQNKQLSVGFIDTNSDKKSTITILDNDINMRKSDNYNERLENFNLTEKGDGSYDLNFKVIDGVAVNFVYDEDRNVYEVHFNKDAKATQTEFLQTFTKKEGMALNIEFVNNSFNTTYRARSLRPRTPVVSVEV